MHPLNPQLYLGRILSAGDRSQEFLATTHKLAIGWKTEPKYIFDKINLL
jgi:hypothetical protein